MSNVVFFDGVDDYVDCGGGATLNLNAAFTIEVLMKRISERSGQELIGRWAANGYILYLEGATKRASMYLNADARYANNAIPPIGRWTRITFTWTAGGNLRAYMNGNLTDVLAAVAACTDSATNLHISGVFGGFSRFDGSIAQVTIYNRQLTDAEVLYNYEHPGNPIRRGIVLNLTQESIQGAQWLDLSGNANHGTYAGGAVPRRANLVTQR